MKHVLAVVAILVFTGCHKYIDKFYKNDPIAWFCKLKSIKTVGEYDTHLQTFYNNKWGEPDSITFEETGSGTPALHFTYDKNGRLVKHTQTNEGTYYYVYKPGLPMPVRDTLIDYYTNVFVHTFTYDDKGRIVKVFVDWLRSDFPEYPVEDREIVYQYNERGNLYNAGGILYTQHDNKVNFLRTSKVLQFIYRDYSLNNRVAATRYNKQGLPELYDYSSLPPKSVPYIRQEIQYVCVN